MAHVLFTSNGHAYSPGKIREEVNGFGYNAAIAEVIRDSVGLDTKGDVFVRCAARILTNFKMTRGGVFKGLALAKDGGVTGDELLMKCWRDVGQHVLQVRHSINESGYSRNRYLLELDDSELENVINEVWFITKQLLRFTMSEHSFGLVGASKIMFSVLPEIVLPVDNEMWRAVFKTVDLGDVLRFMVGDIRRWEHRTGKRLDEIGHPKGLTTLPTVYNVRAMYARQENRRS
jgi:hypothetical protein